MIGFERTRDSSEFLSGSYITLEGELDNAQTRRLNRIKQAWNFYEGYHWEDLAEQDSPEITVNYCRTFVDKYVAFEMGKAFKITTAKNMEGIPITPDGRTVFEYLEDVWEDNNQYLFATELGQMKSITGDAWVQVRFYSPDELNDPYNIYPNGRLKVDLLPTNVVFPEYDPHQRGVLTKVTIMYAYEKEVKSPILSKPKKEKRIYKQIWTKDKCVIQDGKHGDIEEFPNRYGTIPFIQIKNLTTAGKNEGRSDLEDLIPLNTEFNMKESNISEIIDYHAAPVTVVYGAKIGNLEKGANKMWGGLAKDARVENLELRGDLGASTNYILNLKQAMCEVGGIPETALGGSQAVSNTSGVALQYLNMPLIERTRVKRMSTEDGLERLNRLILLVSMMEGLVFKPEKSSTRDFFWNAVTLPDTLPKDRLLELQMLQQELEMGLETRRNALIRLDKEDVDNLLKEIDAEKEELAKQQSEFQPETKKLNSGMLNGQTTIEQVRTEMTGQNGGAEIQ